MTDGRSMTYLFSDAGLSLLQGSIDRTTLFAFDLDGTLAPIVADPRSIAIDRDVRGHLIGLNRIATVAVVTGRSCADALSHLGFTPGFLAGNHGAEGLPGREVDEAGYIRLCRDWMKQLRSLFPEGNNAGIVLEDKGATLSLHYRNAGDRARACGEIQLAIARLVPAPRALSGRYVENIVPQGAPHKGEALQFIMRHLGCSRAIFVGDDETDEDVFRLRDDSILGIRVGMSPRSASSCYLRGQDEIGALLEMIMNKLK